jgi:hypothetical protein
VDTRSTTACHEHDTATRAGWELATLGLRRMRVRLRRGRARASRRHAGHAHTETALRKQRAMLATPSARRTEPHWSRVAQVRRLELGKTARHNSGCRDKGEGETTGHGITLASEGIATTNADEDRRCRWLAGAVCGCCTRSSHGKEEWGSSGDVGEWGEGDAVVVQMAGMGGRLALGIQHCFYQVLLRKRMVFMFY